MSSVCSLLNNIPYVTINVPSIVLIKIIEVQVFSICFHIPQIYSSTLTGVSSYNFHIYKKLDEEFLKMDNKPEIFV